MKRLLVLSVVVVSLVVATAATAAKPGPGPIATPASVCRVLADWGAYPSFTTCMARINQDVQSYMSEDEQGNLINLDQRCTELEQGITDPSGEFLQVTYPFYFEEPPGFPLTQFTAVNHHQCELTLYAYHFAFGE
jgi:hypothetical protein